MTVDVPSIASLTREARKEKIALHWFFSAQNTPQLPNPSVVVVVVATSFLAAFAAFCTGVVSQALGGACEEKKGFQALCNISLLTGKYISFVKRKILFMFLVSVCAILLLLSCFGTLPVSFCEFFLPEGLELREDVGRWKVFFFFLLNLFVYGCVSRL
jgi:hypothetical protein